MRLVRLPNWAPMAAITIRPFILVKDQYRDDHFILTHEAVHLRQQERDGLKFFLRYIFRPKWRVHYEAEAYVTGLYTPERGGYTIQQMADSIYSGLYLWPTSRAYVLEALTRAALRSQGN